ncbi:MAG: response regulator [Deltaproteobacteria bacterium]|nr:response regulator [Deltaproteobacteria bacterium]TLN04981.1 MAG: response regulator [bacterium]
MAGIDIIIADDEPHIVRALSFVFERDGYAVETASDGAAALRLIMDLKPRVVFLDLIMPKMTGDEVCKTVKQDKDLQDIHIAILTCKGQELDRELSIASGADSFITKPFSPKEVLQMVKDILGS